MKVLILGLGLLILRFGNAGRHPSLPTFLLGRPSGGFLRDGYRHFSGDHTSDHIRDDQYPNLQRLNFTQKLDHFNSNDQTTFNQRYWYNSNFTRNQKIIFLMIQGESIATDRWAGYSGYTYLRLAEMYGADTFQLEHRCFGFSRPYSDLSTDHLKVCTMSQAIEDLASFIKGMNQKYGFVNPKWVTFGGSYPGTLNALFRAKYPELTVGAIASSAPLNLKLDFYEYAQVVENGLRTTDPSCALAVGAAFKKMQQLSLSNDGRRQLNGYFNLQPPFVDDQVTQLDIDNFFANVYSVFQGVTQYTYDGRNNMTMNGLGLKELCVRMTSERTYDEVIRVNNTINWVNGFYGGPTPFPNSYTDMIKVLSNSTFDDEDPDQDNAANRGWMWLSCNELGFLQTTDQGRNVFQQTVPLNYFIDMCTDMFGSEISIRYIRDHNQAAQQRWKGADGYKATNIVLPNGSYDPWHALGTYNQDANNHLTSILINGTAHCADMYPIYADEPSNLQAARLVIEMELKFFLGKI